MKNQEELLELIFKVGACLTKRRTEHRSKQDELELRMGKILLDAIENEIETAYPIENIQKAELIKIFAEVILANRPYKDLSELFVSLSTELGFESDKEFIEE